MPLGTSGLAAEPGPAGEQRSATAPADGPAGEQRPAPPTAPAVGIAPQAALDIVVIGGGPSGAAVALRLARAGHAVLLAERNPAWRWRAGGVFASPAALAELRALGLPPGVLEAVARPIPAMRVETPAGTAFELTYGAESGGGGAVGFDRSALDPALVAAARAAGADVRTGVPVREVRLADHRQPTQVILDGPDGPGGEPVAVACRVVIGADGPRSMVSAAAGMTRPPRLAGRVGLSWHVADEPGDEPKAARMVVLPGGAYCGLAPVPGGRLNIGIVLAGRAWRDRLAGAGAAATGDHVLRSVPPLAGDAEAWREGVITDGIAGASPLGCRVERRAGPDWLVVGDAAGFLDPFTGEGLHRAFVSARLAADAVDAHLSGDPAGLAAYDRAMRDRFATKDRVSLLVQSFLARPALFEHAARRLARKPDIRATMGLVMGDLVPASRAFDPRLLAGLLIP
jgi:flavin-dependent dehydrogenase